MNNLKYLFLIIAMNFSASALASFDGCYQMYMPEKPAVRFCLSGTNEEGIGGAGARLALFSNFGENVLHCPRSSALRMTPDSLDFVVGQRVDLALSKVETKNGLRQGYVQTGNTAMMFVELDAETSQRLLRKAAAHPYCNR